MKRSLVIAWVGCAIWANPLTAQKPLQSSPPMFLPPPLPETRFLSQGDKTSYEAINADIARQSGICSVLYFKALKGVTNPENIRNAKSEVETDIVEYAACQKSLNDKFKNKLDLIGILVRDREASEVLPLITDRDLTESTVISFNNQVMDLVIRSGKH